MKIATFSSSSKGNMTYINSANANIIIDVGISYKKFNEGCLACSFSNQDIDAILITHEHTDHIKGLPVFLKKLPSTLIYASDETADYIWQKGYVNVYENLRRIKAGVTFMIKNLEITPFETPHDSVSSFGYYIKDGLKSFCYVTDLGHITPCVHEYLVKSDGVVIESNYEENLLQVSSYPYLLKRRIASNSGHLNNIDCSCELARLINSGTNNFIIAHLSEENNHPVICKEGHISYLKKQNLTIDVDYTLQIAPAKTCSEVMEL